MIARSSSAAPRAADAPPVAATLVDGELHLHPLEHRHLDEVRRQYADPSIAALCGWPVFANAAAWHGWLDEMLAEPDHVLFGIRHRQWGLLGCAGLAAHDGIGFFHYWLGRDFRGRGYGSRAGRTLLHFARERCGLRACYAKVFAGNLASQRSLLKIGFHFADVAIASTGTPAELLLCWPGRHPGCADEARQLFAALGADIHVSTTGAARP